MNTQQQAQHIIDHAVVIDTETTGFRPTDQVIEVCAILARTGEVLLDTLVYNDGQDVEQEAMDVHGITVDMMAGGMPVDGVMSCLHNIKHDFNAFLTSYNVPFDSRLINQTLGAIGLKGIDLSFDYGDCKAICAMEVANRHFMAEHGVWVTEEGSKQNTFKRLSLAKCCEIAGIEYEGEAHRAYADTRAAVDLMRAIAEGRV